MAGSVAKRVAAAMLGLSLIGALAGASAAGPADASEPAAQAFVQGFYDWYLKGVLSAGKQQEKNPKAKDFGFIDAVRQRPTWFSPDLKRLLEEDIAASRRCPGDVVGLDWDPFLETQDPAPTYTAGKVEKTAKGFRVSIDFHNKNFGGVKNPTAQADVALVGGQWTFVDFVEEPADPKSRQGLVALLKSFERTGEYKCQP